MEPDGVLRSRGQAQDEEPAEVDGSRSLARPLALLLVVLASGCGEEERDAPPQRGDDFVGIYSDDVYFEDAAYKRRTLARQHEAGIRLIRQPFAWNEFEEQPERFDEFVGECARAGIQILPMVLGPEPGSDRPEGGMRPPQSPSAYARYAAALVRRYGPEGSFWEENPDVRKLPIRSWQIWNEPNIPSFWSTGPDAAEYARLLVAAARAIREVDPEAEIVAAGLPESRLGASGRRFLEDVLRAGGREAVDTVAVHPYAATPDEAAANVRAIARVAPGKRVWVTEIGWGTGGRPGPFTVTRETQARYVREAFRRLRELRVRGIVWFQWRDPKPFPGRRPIWPFFAGLNEADGAPKPALAALERAAR